MCGDSAVEISSIGASMDAESLRLLYVSRVINYQDGSGVHGRSFVDAFASQANIMTFPQMTPFADIPWHLSPRLPIILGKPIHHWIPTPFETMVFVRDLQRSLRDFRRIKHLRHDWKPNAILVRQQGVDFVAALLAKDESILVALEVNAPLALEVRRERPSGWLDIYRRSEEWAWHHAHSIFVVSNELKNILVDAGVPQEKIHINPNGVNEHDFDPSVLIAEEAKLRLGLPVSVPIIGFTGSFRSWHGLENLLAAFVQLVSANHDVSLLLVGDGPQRMNIEAWIDKNNLSAKVFITGHVPHKDLPIYISAMDICVAPYPDLNPFYFSPLKIIEFMAMAKPIVASDIGQISELLSDEAGFLVSPGNVQELYTMLEDLLEHPVIGVLAGKKAREKVLASYTWQHNARRVTDVLCTMLSRSKTNASS